MECCCKINSLPIINYKYGCKIETICLNNVYDYSHFIYSIKYILSKNSCFAMIYNKDVIFNFYDSNMNIVNYINNELIRKINKR